MTKASIGLYETVGSAFIHASISVLRRCRDARSVRNIGSPDALAIKLTVLGANEDIRARGLRRVGN